jgi:hypothetical protein
MMNDSTQDPLNSGSPGSPSTPGAPWAGQSTSSATEEKYSFGSAKKDDFPEAKKRVRGELADDGRKPIAAVLHECRRTFYLAIGITAMVDLLSITPMLYMLNVMDRAINSRSGVTLVSLTVLVIALYLFWSAIETVYRIEVRFRDK